MNVVQINSGQVLTIPTVSGPATSTFYRVPAAKLGFILIESGAGMDVDIEISADGTNFYTYPATAGGGLDGANTITAASTALILDMPFKYFRINETGTGDADVTVSW